MKIQSLKILAIALMLAIVPLSVSTVYAGSNGHNNGHNNGHDNGHNNGHDNGHDNDKAGLPAEIIARKAADANLQANINSEESARKAADAALKDQIENIVAPPRLLIGDDYGGGKVFWVDEDGQHGLIAAPTDQSEGIQWYNGSFTDTNASRGGVNAGGYNTERIIINQGAGSYAAQLCANYQGGGYGDWYLPSIAELNLMYLNIGPGAPSPFTNVGGFATDLYWSSTESASTHALSQNFLDGTQPGSFSSKGRTFRVRAVRAF